MLIRIAPDMFIDERFECVTVNEVRKEIFQTQRFKTKYAWRKNYKNKIIPVINIINTGNDFTLIYDSINQLIDACIINKKTARTFGLSSMDKRIAAYTIANKLQISSDDKDLIVFLEQEFDIKNIGPLAIVNDWIKKGLIALDDNLQNIIEDWKMNDEPPQPNLEKENFEKLTGFKYLGF